MLGWRFARFDERGVSDLIGTILLLGMTVALFSGLTVVVMSGLSSQPPPPNAEFRINTLGERTSMILVWGESVALTGGQLIYDVDSLRQTHDLAVEPLASNLSHGAEGSVLQWDLGEPLRLSCPLGQTCAHPGTRIGNISLVDRTSNAVVFSSEPGVTRGVILVPVADLAVTVDSIADPGRPPTDPLYIGGTIVVSATVTNTGLLPTAGGSVLTVKFYLDGSLTPFHSYQYASILGAGESFSVQTPSFTFPVGAHTVRVRVDAGPPFLEASLDNNERTQGFNVVVGVFDPGYPYEDGNDDVLYNPYTVGDVQLAASAVTDGVHTAAAGKGLVIPPSVGPITVSAQNVLFDAPLKLTIATPVTTTSTRQITFTAGTQFRLPGAIDISSSRKIAITATGQIDISSDTFDTNNQDITITTTGGPVLAQYAVFSAPGGAADADDVRITASGGYANFTGAIISVKDDITLKSNGFLDLRSASMISPSTILFDVTAALNVVYVQGVVVDDSNDCAKVIPITAIVTGTPASGQVRTTC